MPNRIDSTFGRLRRQREKALIGYITAGFPSRGVFRPLVHLLAENGVDILEIGVPFSDPIADGPTIQYSSQIALTNGVTLSWILDEIRALRRQGIQIPLVLMTYCNPVHAAGIPRFFSRAASAGVDGVIVPDMIPEEAHVYAQSAKRHGIHMIHLVTPATPGSRVKTVAAATRGFLYAVSLTGVTGARRMLPKTLRGFLTQLSRHAKTPVAVGFGISTPAQVRELARYVDGVIIGSALIQQIQKDKRSPFNGVKRFVRAMKGALHAA